MINSTVKYDFAEDFEQSRRWKDNKMYYEWSDLSTCGHPDNQFLIKDEHFPDCFVNDNLKRKRYKIEEVKEIIKQVK